MNKDTNTNLKAMIVANNSGKKIPAEKVINDSPVLAAVMSKLNNLDRETKYNRDGNRTIVSPNQSGMTAISQDVSQKSTDNENTLQLFPELEQGLRILINAVMSPKDLNGSDMNFTLPTNLKVSPLSGLLLTVVMDKLSKDFKLKEMIPEMLYKTLGVDGSYPVLVIPESSVDDMINDQKSISTESLQEHFGNGNDIQVSMGFLGDNDLVKKEKNLTVSFESFISSTSVGKSNFTDGRVRFNATGAGGVIDTFVRVTDNIELIKFPEIVKIKRQEQVSRTLEKKFRGSAFYGNESIIATENYANADINGQNKLYASKELNDMQLSQLLYKNNASMRNVTRKVKTSNETSRLNIGAPLVKVLSAESVIPVCMAGDKTKHVAFFILLDGMGNPLSKNSASSVYDDFRRNQRDSKGGTNLSSHLLQRTANAFNTSCDLVTYQQMQKVCSEIIETDFLARLRNGIYGEDVALVESTIVYDIMLSRMFRDQQTQVLFVPAELMTYFHYKLRVNGTGKTLLEDSMVLNSLRAVLMFANVNRAVINSIGRTEVELSIDAADPNKAKTLEIAKHEVLRTRQSQALPATISPTDINQYLHTSQMYFNINAVEGLPGTSVKFNETQTSYAQPDSLLTEQLDKKAIMALGIPPELVSNSNDVEFATNIVANNLRLNKQILQLQDAYQPQICSFVRIYAMNHGTILTEIETVIGDNLKLLTDVKNPDEFFSDFSDNPTLLVRLLAREFLSNIEVGFSRPDTVTLKNQMEALTEFEEALDKILKYRLSEDILSEATSGTITSEQIGLIFNSVKAHYVRDWLKKNTIMPELFDIVSEEGQNKPSVDIFNVTSGYANTLTASINSFLKRVIPVSSASQRDMETATNGEEIGAGPGESSSSGSSSSSSSSDDSGSDSEGSDDEEGGDGMDGLDDMPAMPDMDSF